MNDNNCEHLRNLATDTGESAVTCAICRRPADDVPADTEMQFNPRRPLDDDNPDGYQESDRDFLENNNDLAVFLLENYPTTASLTSQLRAAEEREAVLESEVEHTRRDIHYLAGMLGVGYDLETGQYDDGSMKANIGMFPQEFLDALPTLKDADAVDREGK